MLKSITSFPNPTRTRGFLKFGYQATWGYETAGQSPDLLSLAGDWYSFTGGAHGMYGSTALLWNRRAKREIEPIELFDTVTAFALLRPAMCAELNKERSKSREGEVKMDTGYAGLDDAFNGCPTNEELTVWIKDNDGNGRFDSFEFAADPYVAGPYSEGGYGMSVPVTAQLIASLKPEYRPSFEPQPPVQ